MITASSVRSAPNSSLACLRRHLNRSKAGSYVQHLQHRKRKYLKTLKSALKQINGNNILKWKLYMSEGFHDRLVQYADQRLSFSASSYTWGLTINLHPFSSLYPCQKQGYKSSIMQKKDTCWWQLMRWNKRHILADLVAVSNFLLENLQMWYGNVWWGEDRRRSKQNPLLIICFCRW